MAHIITNTDPTKGEVTLNCNPNLVHYVIPVHSQEWFDFRTIGAMGYTGGFGASEVYKTLQKGSEQYEPVLPQLLEQKAGISPVRRNMTSYMLAGILHENTILDLWQYYDGTHDGYITNYMNRDKKRVYGRVGAYIVNKNYDWLFASLDGYIERGYYGLHGVFLEERCPLEIKTIGFQASQSYDGGIPTSYIYQVQQQMLVTETDYCEIAILEGGSQFRVLHFEANIDLQNEILEHTYKNWQIVKSLREMREERDSLRVQGDYEGASYKEHEMNNLLPIPTGGDAYSEYYSSKNKVGQEEEVSIIGVKEHIDLLRDRQYYKAMSGLWEEEVSRIDNIFRDIFIKNSCNVIEFDKLGRVKYTKKTNGKNYYPTYNSYKDKIDMTAVNIDFIRQIKQYKNEQK